MPKALSHICALFALLSAILLSSCSVEIPQDVISESKMESILMDYHLAQAMAEADREGDVYAQRYLLTQAVFHKHGITEAEFDSSMVWYSAHSEYLYKMYQHIDERMKREAEKVGLENQEIDVFANLSADGDTANIWQGETHMVLRPALSENILTYRIPCDSTFRTGDSFMWQFDQWYVASTAPHEAFALMTVEYGDTTVSATTHIYGDGHSELRIPMNEKIKHLQPLCIRTHIYMQSDQVYSHYRLLLLGNVRLIRIHSQESTIPEEVPTVEADSIETDTLVHHGDTASQHRMSPEEFRASQKHVSKINVVKEKPIRYVRKPLTRSRLR